jgi:hypothetical protein
MAGTRKVGGSSGSYIIHHIEEMRKRNKKQEEKIKYTQIARNNLQGFIDGRQFLVLVVVFLIRLLTEPVSDATVLGLPKIVCGIFLKWGLAVILITITPGPLTSQINKSSWK